MRFFVLDKVLNNYQFENKSCLLKVVDAILSPTRQLMGAKTVHYDSQSKNFREEDLKSKNVFYKIVLLPAALLLIPVTLVACLIKVLEGSTQKIHLLYQSKSEKGLSSEQNAPSSSEHSQEPSLEKVPNPAQREPEKGFTRERLKEIIAHIRIRGDRSVDEQEIGRLSDLQVQVIGDLLLEFSQLIDQWVAGNENCLRGVHFTIRRSKPHVFKVSFHDAHRERNKPISSPSGEIEVSRYFVYKLFEGYAISRTDLFLGTGDCRDQDEFFIYHKDILNDHFDADHICSDMYPGHPFQLNMANRKKRWLRSTGIEEN